MRRVELVDFNRALRESRQDLQFAAQRLDDFSQCRNLHVVLFFELRQARLLHAERLGNFLLAFAGQLPNLAEEQFPEQFLGTASRLRLRFLCGRPFDQIVE